MDDRQELTAADVAPAQPAAKPVPLNLDWDSPEGRAHHKQMCALPPDDPVAVAHFENIGEPHPAAVPHDGQDEV